MLDALQYNVFLSHNPADKPRVRPRAERLRADGLEAPVRFGFRNSEFGFAKPSISACEFGVDWARVKDGHTP